MKLLGLRAVFGGVTLLSLAVMAGGCSSDDPAPVAVQDLRRPLLASWGEFVIVPQYQDLERDAAALHEASMGLCAEPSAERLEAARTAWWTARGPWKRAEVFAFGPFKEEPLRLGPKIDFWPVRINTLDGVLAETSTINADTLGASKKGFPAIEYLLYRDDASATLTEGSRACDYLVALTGDLAVRAQLMRQAWDPNGDNYLAELVDAGENGAMFETVQRALSEIVNRMAFTVENIRNDKLGRPLGTTSGGSVQPDKAESYLSGRSLTDIRDNLSGIEVLYFGTGDPDSLGLDDHVVNRNLMFADQMRTRLTAAQAALDEIPEPLTESVADAPQSVSNAIEVLRELQTLIQVDILNALSLTPIFNDTDGD